MNPDRNAQLSVVPLDKITSPVMRLLVTSVHGEGLCLGLILKESNYISVVHSCFYSMKSK